MAQNRILDNATIARDAANETVVRVARADAMASTSTGKAKIWDLKDSFAPMPAAFANALAVRFPDNDDCYLAAEYSQPDDNTSPNIPVGQGLANRGSAVKGLRPQWFRDQTLYRSVGGGDRRSQTSLPARTQNQRRPQ